MTYHIIWQNNTKPGMWFYNPSRAGHWSEDQSKGFNSWDEADVVIACLRQQRPWYYEMFIVERTDDGDMIITNPDIATWNPETGKQEPARRAVL